MLRENWETLGSDLGHIIYGEDKADYDNLLGSNLTREGMDSFSAPFMVVDLNNMERRTYAAAVRVIDENRVLYTVNVGGVLKAGVVNPKDTSTSKFFLRQAFPQDDQYLLCYFPKVSLTDEGWQVQAKYEKRDRYYENLLGKDDFENNLTPAVDNFMRAFAKEDQFKQESYAAFQKLVTPDLLQKLRSEPALDVQGILDLMLVMADSRCREEAPAIFGISSAEYASYEEKILQFLEEAKNLSREEFLVEAIKICDGRAALAAVIAYNTLLPLGEIGNNALFTRYPRAFRMLEDMQDQAGSIYHYYGTFFAAYSLQRWLVDRYHQDGKFASTIDKWGTRLQKGNGTANLDTATLSEYYDLLLIAQFQYLSVGGSDAKEIMSLAGIFFEEVYEDRELSKETHEDIRGMSAGHAFYELVSGNKLVEEASWRKVFVNMAKNFMTSDLEWWQKLLLRFMAQ